MAVRKTKPVSSPPKRKTAPVNGGYPGSQEAARKAGNKYYRSGTVCLGGHRDPLRYASNGACVKCAIEGSRRRRDDIGGERATPAWQVHHWRQQLVKAQRRAAECEEKLAELGWEDPR